MDSFDRQRFASVYRLLAEVLEHDRAAGQTEHLSHTLGDLARRVFVGTEYDPPDELLEQAALAIRKGDAQQLQQLAQRLRRHAEHLEGWTSQG